MSAAYLKSPPVLPSTNIRFWCFGKQKFESAALAHEVAKRSPHNLESYRCITCGVFHVGNPRKDGDRKAAKQLIR